MGEEFNLIQRDLDAVAGVPIQFQENTMYRILLPVVENFNWMQLTGTTTELIFTEVTLADPYYDNMDYDGDDTRTRLGEIIDWAGLGAYTLLEVFKLMKEDARL